LFIVDNSTAAAEKVDEPLPPPSHLIYKNKTADEKWNTLWQHTVLDFTQARWDPLCNSDFSA
jgi:hypothetical protein